MATGLLSAGSVARGFTQTFDNRALQARPFYPKIATIVQSTGYDEKYGWIGDFPGMREWLGERKFKELLMADYTLANKLWEQSLIIEKTVWDDNRLGTTKPLIEGLADEAMYHPDELMFQVLVAGEAATLGTAYDGQFFFDTDHVFGDSGSQSNDLTYAAATGTTPTVAEFRAAYNQAYAALIGFKGDNGKPFWRPALNDAFNKSIMVLVPAVLYGTAMEAIGPQIPNDSGYRTFVAGMPEVIPISHLTDATKFYVLNVGTNMKPFVFQQRDPLRRQVKEFITDDIEHKHFKVMTQARYNVGYLAWWNAVLTTFT
jgi:phage major head subunit gpT-like protein